MITTTTAIFGGIDSVKSRPIQTVDNIPRFFNEYSVLPKEIIGLNDRTKALYYKTQAHYVVPEDNDIIIWIDGKIQVLAEDFIEQCVTALGDGDIAIMKHLYRKCIYEEVDHIEHCIKHGNEYLATRYADRPLRKEVEFYRSRGYPKDRGLNDCCIICRRNNGTVNAIFDEWWDACKLEFFDQVAIQYLTWKAGIEIQPIVFKPGSFQDIPHRLLK